MRTKLLALLALFCLGAVSLVGCPEEGDDDSADDDSAAADDDSAA